MRKVMEFDIFSLVENDEIECKKAGGGLPKDLWETYSAFANTIDGIRQEDTRVHKAVREAVANLIHIKRKISKIMLWGE